MPSLHAVEDVPVTYDFSANISDPDNPRDLEIRSVSPYVISVQDFNLTFLFPNGVLEARVPLELSDGGFGVLGTVDFMIQPVNDPPEHDIPVYLAALEDETFTIDLASHVWDIDNAKEDLSLLVDTPYATADGLNLTVVFPDGVLEYDLWFNMSDGLNLTQAMIHFTVTPVDDPPVIEPPPVFTAVEDQVSVLNLTSFFSDVDTPIEDLTVEVSDTSHCTVVGQELHFLYTVGGKDDYILITISDGTSEHRLELKIHVLEVNDAPIVATPPPLVAVEDETVLMDLTEYVTDEETARNKLVIECEHPAVVGIEGLTITLLYTTWENSHSIQFSVFDGLNRTDGSFDVQVQAVNDPPEINFIPLPLIEVPEDETYTLVLTGEDEEGDDLTWSDDTDLFDISPTDGTITFLPGQSEVGEWWVNITVEDSGGLTDEVLIRFAVLNVNDEPIILSLSPENGSKYKEGKIITFIVEATDEDGDELTV
ncbi:MAG: hypothetical protein KAS77_12390, partial [Thermoplasmata archaeon]|nr:hypothetical protein [Thermoplasmata archaeon]